jgi:hypothetical protein
MATSTHFRSARESGVCAVKTAPPDGKLSPQMERRDSHFCRCARSVILSRNSKVFNAWIIRCAERLASGGSRSQNDSKNDSQRNERSSLRNDRYYCPARAGSFKNQPKCDDAKNKKNDGRNRRCPDQGHITSSSGETPSHPSRKEMAERIVPLYRHVEQSVT